MAIWAKLAHELIGESKLDPIIFVLLNITLKLLIWFISDP